jgi:nucleotide-binding universal stress UspA family protein
MFKKVLYATDFSDSAKNAFQYIKGLWGSGTREVTILHVVDKRGIDAMACLMAIDVLGVENLSEKDALSEVSILKNDLANEGFSVKTRIEKGIPFKEILRVAEEESVSVIIIGAHGKSNVEEMLIGSVAEKVVRKAKRTVLIVKNARG